MACMQALVLRRKTEWLIASLDLARAHGGLIMWDLWQIQESLVLSLIQCAILPKQIFY